MHVSLFSVAIEIDESYVDASPASIRQQLREYEAGDRRTFDVSITFPPNLTGEVMEAMAAIPYGETRTYGDLADCLDTAPIAIGGACGRNPVPILIPCHRVVGSDGELKGYSAADGINTKRRLLEHEGALSAIS